MLYRTKHARTHRLARFVDQHRRIPDRSGYQPHQRRRYPFLVRITITAFHHFALLAPDRPAAASFTLAVNSVAPSPCRPVAASGIIICSLRAPELSATSIIDLIIKDMSISLSALESQRTLYRPGLLAPNCRRVHVRHFRHQRRLCGQCPSTSSASASTSGRGLFDLHCVSGVRLVLFVVRIELLADSQSPAPYIGCAFLRVTSTTIVFCILFETTMPISSLLVLLLCFRLACSFRHHFFSVLLADFAALFVTDFATAFAVGLATGFPP